MNARRRRQRTAAPLAGSALLLAVALTLTACQQSDPGGDAGESGTTAETTATASPSGASGPDGSPTEGGSGGSPTEADASPSGRDAEISASSLPDHLLPPDAEETSAMMRALEKTMGRPVTHVQTDTVKEHEHSSRQALEMVQDPTMNPMESEQCREVLVGQYRTFAEALAQTTRFSGEQPSAGGDGDTVSMPYLVEVTTFEDAASARRAVDAYLEVADSPECADEPMVTQGGSGYEEHTWREGTRYTFTPEDEGRVGILHAGTLAIDGHRVIAFTDGDDQTSGEDAATMLARHAEAADALAQILGEPLRD
jgi:hypothetical protein